MRLDPGCGIGVTGCDLGSRMWKRRDRMRLIIPDVAQSSSSNEEKAVVLGLLELLKTGRYVDDYSE